MTRQGYGDESAESIRPARACAVDAGAYTELVFHPVVDQWFRQRYTEPTPVQAQAWPLIAAGHDVLLTAPTGSGKTLAAFLACLDQLFREAVDGRLEERTAILYVSPLKALSNDVRRNLEEPLRDCPRPRSAPRCGRAIRPRTSGDRSAAGLRTCW
jgi:Lhr-like helicase